MLASKVVFIDLGCAAPTNVASRLWDNSRTREPARCGCHTHRRTPAWWDPLFPGCVHPLYGSTHGGSADLHRGHYPQILTPLLQSDERALLYVLFEQLAGSLVYLGF